MTLVSIDDDLSIHDIWSERIKTLSMNMTLKHFKFTSAHEFKNWYYQNKNESNIIYLFDFELIGQKKTGLDLIEELSLGQKSFLVTSRYEDENIQNRCINIGVKIIPKDMAGILPISFQNDIQKIDFLMLDNDELIHKMWKYSADQKGLKYKLFYKPGDLYQYLKNSDYDTPIYIDSNLDDNIKGEDIALKLNIDGFNNLYLSTGYSPEQFNHLPFLKGIIGKDFPF